MQGRLRHLVVEFGDAYIMAVLGPTLSLALSLTSFVPLFLSLLHCTALSVRLAVCLSVSIYVYVSPPLSLSLSLSLSRSVFLFLSLSLSFSQS